MKKLVIILIFLSGCAVFKAPDLPEGCSQNIETGELKCPKRPPAEDCTEVAEFVYICGKLREKLDITQ